MPHTPIAASIAKVKNAAFKVLIPIVPKTQLTHPHYCVVTNPLRQPIKFAARAVHRSNGRFSPQDSGVERRESRLRAKNATY